NPSLYTNPAVPTQWKDQGCFGYVGPQIDNPSSIIGSAGIANFHIGVPHKRDTGKDDIQLMYASSGQFLQYYSSYQDAQPLLNALIGVGYAWLPQWPDFYTYAPGTPFLALANAPVIGYAFPGSPTNRCINQTGQGAALLPIPNACPTSSLSPASLPPGVTQTLPLDYRDGRWDTASIMKAQYQWNIDQTSYLRLFGYLFYSYTSRSGAVEDGMTGPFGSVNLGGTNYEYQLNAHTRGGELQYAKQLSWEHQLIATINYTTATTLRYDNFNDFNTAGQQVSNLTNGSQCFASMDGTLANGVDVVTAGEAAPCNDPITQGTFSDPTGLSNASNPENVTCAGGPNDPIPPPACAAGASWGLTFTGNQAAINSIKPVLGNISLSDDWRPNSRLVVNVSLRFDRDEYDLTPVADTGKNFWYTAAQKEFCYDPTTFQPVIVPQPPQSLHVVQPYVTFNCPLVNGVQTVHPDGLNGHVLLSDSVPASWVQWYGQPRVGATLTLDPNTVLRVSAGRFAQQPQNYEVEYNSLEPNLAAQLIGFLPFGYNTPFHPALAQFSDNYDISYEHSFPGTDVAMKLTPYYRWATNQLYSANVPTLGLSPSFNAGTQRVSGVELLVTKGDFHRNGLSGQFSYTYTNSTEMWNNYQGVSVNAVDPFNQDIANYNALTQSGGGAPCYDNTGTGTPDPTCAATSIVNPYYTMKPQPLLDKYGWYPTGLDAPYISPNTFALVLSYRHDRIAIAPVLSLNQGAVYGNAADFQGLDPRTCESNQSSEGIAGAPNPLTADYTSCHQAAVGAGGTRTGYLFIPNPYTGTFDTFGQFRQPWQLNMGLQLEYDVSPSTTVNITAVNLVNSCWGGSSEPWTTAYPPNSQVCGYARNKFFISNFYNGASPNDTAANGVPLNKYFTVPFAPAYGDVNSFNLPMPTEWFFQVSFKA
ncbi:MAG: TonB-dependent receptor, partial [Candidatus Eremiobacteraeota bacterium]|nr:TonB-dependent receptor [Candidatus Eremiobacteraeota bacterium]